ncbi:MAG: tRNA uridine-5-carboxymethylaminomethyl(34) synthesis GTPase MnmE [Candidatus Caenarcaniphilales bacterium]|nr:tRNA uridine-5-carboxymethylaminomethyl(34) synthesis GTPase MnmE [Candidatus Caenarcaniphilales bacterium]
METIAAIVTSPGTAAVSIIRLSGSISHEVIKRISNISDEELIPGSFKLKWIIEKTENIENKIDQALILNFKAPKSFTGEDVIEIQCHGGSWLSKKILELCLENGARLAKPGEFTERALLNKKIDLSQAEGILDLIHSRTELSGANAVNLYQGFLGQKIKTMRDALLKLLAELIACIDFPDEVDEYPVKKFTEKLSFTILDIEDILRSEKSGQILREGFKVALAGKPNAGKSSLLNTLLKNDRAIVTDIAGTTRDIIEESMNLNGIPVVLSDTAGIRDSDDTVEKIGIELSKKAIQGADLILWLEDINNVTDYDNFKNEIEELKQSFPDKDFLVIGTKVDLLDETNENLNSSNFNLVISNETQLNIEELKNYIYNKANPELKSVADSCNVSINSRQADLLRQCKESLAKALEAADSGIAHDFWTIDLKAAIARLGEITGDDLTEEILDNMFSQFCIGK